ncbi:ATP-binding cassette domain-containing protein [Microbacterium marinilacus]|nr:ATP-binding cassette domain-containing protein [Microbacterium marinilacus]
MSVRYPARGSWVGDKVTIRAGAGERILLLGPSGCGKSTLLLALTGLIPASIDAEPRGTVECTGVDTRVVRAGQLAESVGVVFQDPDAQIVTATLLDEVCFGLENLLVPAELIEERALDALRHVGLADTRDEALRSPAELSGGNRQRLAIACALALNPAVLVLDEPTANLDPVAAAEFYQTLNALAGPERTIIMVEHDLDDALEVADRVIVLSLTGTVLHDGTPHEVIGVHARALLDLGIWLPTATRLALRLGLDTGPESVLPLSVAELAESAIDTAGRLHVAERPASPMPPDEPRSGVHVCVDHARVNLGKKTILGDISLDVHAGEFLAVAGVNGAGKSTLTRAIAGLIPLASGTVSLRGVSLTSLTARDLSAQIEYVFQNPEHQFLTPTVREELAYGLRVRGVGASEITDRVGEMLNRFDLHRYAAVNPFLLSHGEKRRLSVATALITQPQILILDEPTFGQDHERASEIIAHVDELNVSGITILMVTHDMQLIADHAHRVALLADGELLDVGPTDLLGDDGLIRAAGLRTPPIHRIARALTAHDPAWQHIYRTTQVSEAP